MVEGFKELKDLVLLAKGNRSFRQYAKACGIDSSTITKMANGQYTPKPKTKDEDEDIYDRLTSKEAEPQNGITAKDLREAANYKRAYQAGQKFGSISVGGVIAGLTIANPIVGAAAATSLGAIKASGTIKQKKNEKEHQEQLKLLSEKVKQFVAIANGIVYGNLFQRGLTFQQIQVDEDNISKRELVLNNGIYKKYVLKYLYAEENERSNEQLIKNSVKRAYEELIFMKPTKGRKVSYIVNCEELYHALCRYKDKLSFSSDLSVIWIDQSSAEFKNEECICKQEEISDETVIKMI